MNLDLKIRPDYISDILRSGAIAAHNEVEITIDAVRQNIGYDH